MASSNDRARIADRAECVHHTGMLKPRNPTCAAGVNYRELGDAAARPVGWVKRMPCIRIENRGDEQIAACASYRQKTAEELAEEARQTQQLFDRMVKLIPVVNAWKAKPPRGKSEIVDCPICGGRLHLSQSPYNGHVSARCETVGCASFME